MRTLEYARQAQLCCNNAHHNKTHTKVPVRLQRSCRFPASHPGIQSEEEVYIGQYFQFFKSLLQFTLPCNTNCVLQQECPQYVLESKEARTSQRLFECSTSFVPVILRLTPTLSFLHCLFFFLLIQEAFENYEYEFEDVSKSIARKLNGQLPNYTGVRPSTSHHLAKNLIAVLMLSVALFSGCSLHRPCLHFTAVPLLAPTCMHAYRCISSSLI